MERDILPDRITFKPREQRIFLLNVKKCSGRSWNSLAKSLDINDRTLRDWRDEKFVMSYEAAEALRDEFNIPLPKDAVAQSWGKHLKEAGKKGGIAHNKKYGRVALNEERRKERWRDWWKKEGKFQDHPIIGVTKGVRKPPFSKQLAEFVGIILGDGGISDYHLTITLNKQDDADYIIFVKTLLENLFFVPVGIYERRTYSATDMVVSRKELVNFCVNKLGLQIGDKIKNKVDIPNWIKCNKQYSIACIRGLFDTDGSVFNHTYKVNEKIYTYKKLEFTNMAENLVKSFGEILDSLHINYNTSKNGQNIRIGNKESVMRYLKIVGSSNLKHLSKFRN